MAYPKKSDEDKYVRINVTMPPELQDRLIMYCQEEERTMSWCVQKALDEWLEKKGKRYSPSNQCVLICINTYYSLL